MEEIRRITEQMKRAMEGPAWHGPSLREMLSDVDYRKAAARAAANAHSIWEIVLHVTAWQDAVRRRLEGDPAELAPEEDRPPVVENSAEHWKAALERMEQVSRRLRDAVDRLEDSDLDQPVAGHSYSVYFMLHGVIQHSLYHAAQIALLKRLL